MRDACIFKRQIMTNIKIVFQVRIHPHPSKRKTGINYERAEVPGYDQEAANAIDQAYKEIGLRTSKVLVGFVIDDKFVEADLTSPYDTKPGKK